MQYPPPDPITDSRLLRPGQAAFENKEKYSDWRFIYVPQEPVTGAGGAATKD